MTVEAVPAGSTLYLRVQTSSELRIMSFAMPVPKTLELRISDSPGTAAVLATVTGLPVTLATVATQTLR